MLIALATHCKCWTPEIRHQRWYLNVAMEIPQCFTHAELLQPLVISVGAVAAQHFENHAVWSEVLSEGNRCLTALIAIKRALELDGGGGMRCCSCLQHCWADGNPWTAPRNHPWLSESSLAPALQKISSAPSYIGRKKKKKQNLPMCCQLQAYLSCWAQGSATWCITSFAGQNFDRLNWSLDPWKSSSICHDYKKNNICWAVPQRQIYVLVLYQWLKISPFPLLTMKLFLNSTCIKNVTQWRIKKKIKRSKFYPIVSALHFCFCSTTSQSLSPPRRAAL